jgi:bile acid:Na+ symporter, BASS family
LRTVSLYAAAHTPYRTISQCGDGSEARYTAAMSTAIIMLAIKASLGLTVLAIGLRSRPGDATFLLRHPALLARSVLAMNVLMPLLALWLTIVFDLHPAVRLALIALALSPVPPFLPNRMVRVGGHGSYVVGLFVAASLAAIVVVPVSATLLGRLFGVPFRMPPGEIAQLVGASVLAPIALGMSIRRVAPHAAARAAAPITRISNIALAAAVIPLLVGSWPLMRSLIGNGTLAAIVAMAMVGLGVGHLFGGPNRDDRVVLALATASRHPAVAIAIVSANFPGEKLVPVAVVLSLLVSALASVPYTAWAKRWIRRPSLA